MKWNAATLTHYWGFNSYICHVTCILAIRLHWSRTTHFSRCFNINFIAVHTVASFPGLLHLLFFDRLQLWIRISYCVWNPWCQPCCDQVIRFSRPSPSVFAYCKRTKAGDIDGLGTRLTYRPTVETSIHVVYHITSQYKVLIVTLTASCSSIWSIWTHSSDWMGGHNLSRSRRWTTRNGMCYR